MMVCRACGAILVSHNGQWVCASYLASPVCHSNHVKRGATRKPDIRPQVQK